MRATHLKSALLALALLGGLLLGGLGYARSVEERGFYAIAGRLFNQKLEGRAFQAQAFQHPDVLPLYASSELLIAPRYQRAYWPNELFKSAPTGFTVFTIGRNDASSITVLEKLAAVGADLRGKKVVISLSPSWFWIDRMLPPDAYAANFSRLQANELIFDAPLSGDLKQAIARRMLDYPGTLARDPILRFALKRLADGSPLNRALFLAALPLGKLQTLVLQLQDHWESASYLGRLKPADQAVARQPRAIDWPKLTRSAEQHFQNHNRNNPYGFDDSIWHNIIRDMAAKERNSVTDAEFYRDMQNAMEWHDLDLLMQTLRELGAKPLFLGIPFPGSYYTDMGVSAQARQVYYQRLNATIARYGFPLRDFADHDGDRNFAIDNAPHLSAKGWAYFDQAIDAFYHDALR